MSLSPERKKLLDKITKLLALADSSEHEGEAANAKAAAAKLMADNELSLSDLTQEEHFEFEDDPESATPNQPRNELKLRAAIGRLNGVYVIGVYKGFEAAFRQQSGFRITGKSSNIEAYRYMLAVVHMQRKKAWKSYSENKNAARQERQDWMNGFAIGVSDKIAKLMRDGADHLQERGLVLVPTFLQTRNWYIDNVGQVNRDKNLLSGSVDGLEAGRNVTLHRGVKDSAVAQRRISHG